MDAVAAAAGNVTPEQTMALLRPDEVALSPDGSRIAFTVAASFREQGKAIERRLWVGEVDGDVQAGPAGSHPRFSPDGSRLAYATDRGHEGRLSLWIDDGEVGKVPGSVEDICWSPEGDRLLVLAADMGADMAGAQSAKKIEEAGAEEQDPKVIRPGRFWRRLWLIDAASGETHDVTPEGVNVFEFGWAGGKVAAVCTDDPSESAWYDAWIGLIDIDALSFERVHTPKWQLQAPRISPGGRVAFVEGFSSDRGTLTGTVHVLGQGPLAPELHATSIDFADEDSLWVAGWRRAGSFAGRLSLDGSFEEVVGGNGTLGPRYCPAVATSADGSRVATAWDSPDEPPEVVLFEDGTPRTLTALNAEVAPQLATIEWRTHRWESFDGLEIEGLLALPRTRGEGPLPLVVDVHGGPTGSWSWQFAPAYGFAQLLTSAGYAVLLPNVRGSVGWGPEFAEANLGDMGGGDLQDILTGIDALVREGLVDDGRVAITGGSYGGFMSCWAVTQTDRFARRAADGGSHRLGQLPLHDEHRPVRPALPPGRSVRPGGRVHAALARLPRAELQDADADPPRRGRPLHTARAGGRVLQGARRSRLRDGARRLPARGSRLDRARPPERRLVPHARLARTVRLRKSAAICPCACR